MLAFHFPQYLTTPELRKSYDVALIRQLMFWSLVVAGALSLVNLLFRRAPWLAAAAFALVLLCALLGGAFLLHIGRFVLDGNLGALILRCALRLGRALHRHGAYFPSLSSTTS